MRTIIPCNPVLFLLIFTLIGLMSSCLSALETGMGLVGKHPVLDGPTQPVALAGIADNLSGITKNDDTGTYMAVLNSPPTLLELDETGSLQRRINLQGFADTEDIAWLGGNRFAVVEERLGQIRVFSLDSSNTISAAQTAVIDLGSRHPDNKGFESLWYDHATRTLFTMLELPPYDLISLPLDNPHHPQTRTRLHMDVDDVAAISRDAHGDWWVLSEASRCVVRIKKNRVATTYPVQSSQTFHPEGLTITPDHRLVIVGEPNLLVSCLKPGP